jgi:transcriptional regulator with XRE-family HTH domain
MKPNPVDVHVGQRLRQRRVLVGLSQEKLARMVGITFQQVQKYERGANRIVASRLYQLAKVLDVPVSYFFDEISALAANDTNAVQESADSSDGYGHDVMAERETLELVRAYYGIQDDRVRRRAFELLRTLANQPVGADEPMTKKVSQS